MAEKPPVSPGETCTIEITGLGHSGEGVGRFQGFTVFVPYALPGERVDALISVVKKNYAQGRLKQILQTSPHRITPRCSIFESCGGCQLLHLDYDEQLRVKRQTVVDAITRIGKLSEVVVHPAIGAADPWFYRNKMQLPVGDVGGKTAIGCPGNSRHY